LSEGLKERRDSSQFLNVLIVQTVKGNFGSPHAKSYGSRDFSGCIPVEFRKNDFLIGLISKSEITTIDYQVGNTNREKAVQRNRGQYITVS
jgi:hypothetical protein